MLGDPWRPAGSQLAIACRPVAAEASSTLRRTPLFERHVEAGAKIVPFAGWEMPVQYPEGIRAEHMAVREAAGVFDVSHMGEIETYGPDAEAFLQKLLSNDVSAIPVGGAQYSVLCREDGGVLDDLFTYRLEPDRYLTVTNASNHDKDLAWFGRHVDGLDVTVEDKLEDFAMLAVQGPRARDIVQALSDGPLPSRFTTGIRTLAGHRVLVCGTGYTGEDGVEILVAPEDAVRVWDELLRRGAVPAGLAARDTLRLEACYHLYGNDLMEERGPIEETGFIGADAVRAAREAQPGEKLVPFTLTGPGIARQDNPVVGGGVVTSGTLSPCLDVGIGMAYVPADKAVPGTAIEIDVRGKIRPAEVTTRPLYPPKETDG
jgi:aminomethyltransferase